MRALLSLNCCIYLLGKFKTLYGHHISNKYVMELINGVRGAALCSALSSMRCCLVCVRTADFVIVLPVLKLLCVFVRLVFVVLIARDLYVAFFIELLSYDLVNAMKKNLKQNC